MENGSQLDRIVAELSAFGLSEASAREVARNIPSAELRLFIGDNYVAKGDKEISRELLNFALSSAATAAAVYSAARVQESELKDCLIFLAAATSVYTADIFWAGLRKGCSYLRKGIEYQKEIVDRVTAN